MTSRPRYFHVVDFEATCADDGTLPVEEMEIIEVGAVMVDGDTLALCDAFQSFVRPVRHPALTLFCRNLTSISQEQVNAAPDFAPVLNRWRRWAAAYEGSVFCSWGDYDRRQLEQDCRFHEVASPFGLQHINLKAAFSERLRQRRRFGLAAALARAGLELEGTHHRGIDDAHNIARLLPFIYPERRLGGDNGSATGPKSSSPEASAKNETDLPR